MSRIDVHQHIVPPVYAEWLRSQGIREAGGRELPPWSAEEALEQMDSHGIASAVVSVSTPGVHLSPGRRIDSAARAKAREVNEFAAQLAADHPERFAFFAMLCLPDVEGSLAELTYSLDVLGAAGVILLASTHGQYLGDAEHEPLFAELDRRGAVVFVHPGPILGTAVDGIPPFAADFLLDTTRAAYRLVRNGVVGRFPRLKIILSHAGGFVPYASHRLALPIVAETQRSPLEVLEDFTRFYFDTALSGSPAALPSLLAFARPGHVLFGSDWPYAPPIAVSYFTTQLDAYAGLDRDGHAAIDRISAESLFPRFASPSKENA